MNKNTLADTLVAPTSPVSEPTVQIKALPPYVDPLPQTLATMRSILMSLDPTNRAIRSRNNEPYQMNYMIGECTQPEAKALLVETAVDMLVGAGQALEAVEMAAFARVAELDLPQYQKSFVESQYDTLLNDPASFNPGAARQVAELMLVQGAKIDPDFKDDSPEAQGLRDAWVTRKIYALEVEARQFLEASEANPNLEGLNQLYRLVAQNSEFLNGQTVAAVGLARLNQLLADPDNSDPELEQDAARLAGVNLREFTKSKKPEPPARGISHLLSKLRINR